MSDRIIDYKFTKEYEGIRILDFLLEKGYSRQLITNLKKDEDCVYLNNVPVFVNTIIKEGDILTIWIKETEESEKIVPVKLPFEIVYEDEDIIVVNKPAKMPIHPSLNNYENTLGNAAAAYFAEKEEKFVYRCINRLDRDTTGLTIIAKNMLSACVLYDQMINRKIERTYFAIVEGMVKEEEYTIDKPIARVDGSTIERKVSYENGEEAITHVKCLFRTEAISYLELHLDTGRTHQIRVHMSDEGHPLLGDFLYNSKDNTMDRQALHAGKLAFFQPVTGERLFFEVSLPNDMKKVLEEYGYRGV